MIIGRTVHLAIANSVFYNPVNAARDEHDEPYYGMDNRDLINDRSTSSGEQIKYTGLSHWNL
jgi:hypothetical protein